MNELRRIRIKCEIDQLSMARQRIHKIRDDEDRAIAGDPSHGYGNQGATDALSEVGHILLVAIGKLQRARK
jgi:hypothetical protein